MPVQQPHLFSVVIPALNEGDLLRMTVESILSATEYPDYEVLVVKKVGRVSLVERERLEPMKRREAR